MRAILTVLLVVFLATSPTSVVKGQLGRSYRLTGTDLKQRVIWGAQCRAPAGAGMAFGGQDQDAQDGRPHTRILVDGQWQAIDQPLRTGNPLQPFHDRAWKLRCDVKNVRARTRFVYFKGLPASEEAQLLEREVIPAQHKVLREMATLMQELKGFSGEQY
jgi:hypothetical protein